MVGEATATSFHKFRGSDNKEKTTFNMAGLDMERMDKILADVHNALKNAEYKPSGDSIKEACTNMRHAWVIFKWAYQPKDRNIGQKKLDTLLRTWRQLEDSIPAGETIPQNTVREIIEQLWDLFDCIYHAKQDSGIGIPKRRYVGVESKLRSI